jgi:class 3 adenylate cyclase
VSDRVCFICGSALSISDGLPLTRKHGERKLATALFADIKGSVEIMARNDIEWSRRVVDAVIMHISSIIRRHHGTIVDTVGDGVFAVFGAPKSFDAHPRAAVKAALELQDTMHTLSEEGLLFSEVELRIAIHTGDIIWRTLQVGHETRHLPIGQSVNLASRLQAHAEPKSVLIGQSTYDLTKDYFHCVPVPDLRLKGVSSPVIAYKVLKPSAILNNLQIAINRGLSPFVGRKYELSILTDAIQNLQAGRGKALLLVSEAGGGKSRLLYEAMKNLPAACQVLEAFCLSYLQLSPWHSVVQLVRRLLDLPMGMPINDIKQSLQENLAKLEPSLANETDTIMQLFRLDTRSATATDTDPFIRRQKYIMLVLKMFSLAAKAAPLAVFIEDLHWLDFQSSEVIDHLFSLTKSHPILLVCTSRPEGVKEHWSKHNNLILQFGSLDDASSRQLIASLSLGNDLSDGSIATIQRKTLGNPLFIEEIIRSRRPGNLLASDAELTLSNDSKMPATIQMAIAERIDRLPQTTKHYLQVLSVIGVKSKLDLFVKFISKKADKVKVVLEDLEKHGFIACSTVDNEEYVQFVHIMTQEVVSSTLLGETRAVLHEKIADTMRAEYGDLFHEILPELAHHYHSSSNTQKAVEYLRLAGESAIQQSAHQEAQNYFKLALSRLECDSSISDYLIHLSHIWLSLGVSLQVTLGYTAIEVKNAYEHAIHFSEKAGRFECLFAALRGCAVFSGVRADYHDVEQIASRLKKLAKGIPEFAYEHLVMHGLSFSYRGNLAKGAKCYQKGIALRVPPAKSTLIQYSGYSRSSCYSYLALNVLFAGRLRLAKANAQRGLEVAIESGIPIAVAQSRGMYANVYFSHCEFELAQQQHELNIAFADEHGFSYWSLLGRLLTTWGRGFLSSDETAVAEYASYLSAYRNSGALIGITWFLNVYAELLWSFGRHSDALDAIVEAEEIAATTDERFFLADSLRLKGELLAFMASNACHEGSLQCLFQSLQLAHAQGAWLPAMRTAIWLARVLKQACCRDQAALMLGYHYNKVSWVKGPIHDEARSLMADLGIDRSFLSSLKKDLSRMPILDSSRLRPFLSPPVDPWHVLAKPPFFRH